MAESALFQDKIGTVGNVVGGQCRADFFIPWTTPGGQGLCLQDPNGNWWRVTVDVNGVLGTTPISI